MKKEERENKDGEEQTIRVTKKMKWRKGKKTKRIRSEGKGKERRERE